MVVSVFSPGLKQNANKKQYKPKRVFFKKVILIFKKILTIEKKTEI